MLLQFTNKELHSAIHILSLILFSNLQLFAQTVFTDITKQSGIEHQFIVYEGLFGGGACVFDLNNDGFEDIYLTSGTVNDALYLNNGNGTFKNIFDQSGLQETSSYVTQGAIGADVNRDGWVDLFITTITSRDSVKKIPRAENLLFINNGNATFRNATKEYKLDQLYSFSTGACFGDFDVDGYPDLYIANYFQDYEGVLYKINDATIVNANSTSKGYLLKNIKGKYFENVYSDYGLGHKGFGWGAVFTNYDNDDDVDLLINHDFGYKAMHDLLLENRFPKNTFRDVTMELSMDLKINAMGTAVGDYNNDGLLDYYVTNIRFNQFMVNPGQGKSFVEMGKELGVGFISISWGANFVDFDHDTDVDLFVANGDLNPNDVPLANFYFQNDSGKFVDRAHLVGLNNYGVGRGSVVFDMDNDGDQDILVVNQKPVLDYPVESMTKLYRNDSTTGNWIKIALKGIEAETHGLGSRVEVVVGKIKMIREIDGGSSHLSQNSTIAHFGVANATLIDSVIVKWIGGKKQILINQPVNTLLSVTESSDQHASFSWILMWVPVFIILLVIIIVYKARSNRKN